MCAGIVVKSSVRKAFHEAFWLVQVLLAVCGSACMHMQDLRPAVTKILLVPNVTEQRDGRRDTPLMLAWKRGHADVASMLLAAGATDLPSCSPVVGCKGKRGSVEHSIA